MDNRLTEKHVGCVVAALLSANAYPLSKAQGLLPALQRERLLSPPDVGTMSLEAVITGLVNAGYDRGNLTWRFAERLKALMSALAGGKLDALVGALGSRNQQTGVKILDDVPGIGPHVATTAWTLLLLL